VEGTRDVEVVAAHDRAAHHAAVGPADEAGDGGTRGGVELDEAQAGDPVDIAEVAAGDELTGRADRERLHRVVEDRREAGLERAGGGVVRDEVARRGPGGGSGVLDAGEGAARVDGVTDLRERPHAAVLQVRREISRVAGDQRRRGVRWYVHGLGRDGGQSDRQTQHCDRHQDPGEQPRLEST
jgi:hypothetical protein